MATFLGVVFALAMVGVGVAFFAWLHWPERVGGVASSTDSDELDALIAEVGNVDRKRTPGETSSNGGGESFG